MIEVARSPKEILELLFPVVKEKYGRKTGVCPIRWVSPLYSVEAAS